MKNKLTNENNPDIAELLSPMNPPMADLDITTFEDTNIAMKWLWRLTHAGYEGWTQ